MRVGIIASLKYKEEILPTARKVFKNVVFVPITDIKIEIGEEINVWYKEKNLNELDAIIPLPSSHYEFYYTCLKALENRTYIPIPSDKFFMWIKRPVLFNLLLKNGINVKDLFVISYSSQTEEIIKHLKLPVSITSGRKRIVVNNKETLASVLPLFKVGYTLLITKPIIPEENIFTLLVNKRIVASYDEVNKKSIILDESLRKIVLKIREVIESDFFVLNLVKYKKKLWVNDISFFLNFSTFKKITRKDVLYALFANLKIRIEEKRKSLLQEISENLISFFRWMENEVSNLRSIGKRI